MATKCDVCIQKYRKIMFKNKTTSKGMRSYNEVKNDILKTGCSSFFDLYSVNNTCRNDLNDIAHVIPVSIFAPSNNLPNNYLDNNFFINYEPYSDPHIMFITDINVSILRSNYNFGNISDKEDYIIAYNDENTNSVIVCIDYAEDDVKYYGKMIDNNNNVCVMSDLNYGTDVSQMLKIMTYKRQGLTCQQCIVEPPKQYRGVIARMIFYYDFMYAYNSKERPIFNNNMIDVKFGKKYNIENRWLKQSRYIQNEPYGDKGYESTKNEYNHDEKYKESIGSKLGIYMKWHLDNEVSVDEHGKNNYIYNIFGTTNIFVGYYDKTGKYIRSEKILEHFYRKNANDHINITIIDENQYVVDYKYDVFNQLYFTYIKIYDRIMVDNFSVTNDEIYEKIIRLKTVVGKYFYYYRENYPDDYHNIIKYGNYFYELTNECILELHKFIYNNSESDISKIFNVGQDIIHIEEIIDRHDIHNNDVYEHTCEIVVYYLQEIIVKDIIAQIQKVQETERQDEGHMNHLYLKYKTKYLRLKQKISSK